MQSIRSYSCVDVIDPYLIFKNRSKHSHALPMTHISTRSRLCIELSMSIIVWYSGRKFSEFGTIDVLP